MRTIYYKTSNYIEHTGNLVDLEEFRRRQALAQEDSLARQPQPGGPPEERGFQPILLPAPKGRPRPDRERRAWTLDACASLAVILMTAVFALRVLL